MEIEFIRLRVGKSTPIQLLSGKWPQLPQDFDDVIKTKDSRLAEFILRTDLQAATATLLKNQTFCFLSTVFLTLPHTFRGVLRASDVARAIYLNPCIKLKLIGLAMTLYQEFGIKWIFEFFTTTKFERPNHLSGVRSPSGFCFSQISFFPRLQDPKRLKKAFLRFAIFIYNKRLQNIFSGLKKHGVIVKKSLSEKKIQICKMFVRFM